jgi:LacI family transcriptional regulator
VLLIESSRASGRCLLRGIADYARLHGPWAIDWEPAGLEKAWPQIQTLDATGVILRDIDDVEMLLSRAIPAVVVGHSRREIPGVANVITDSDGIAQLAAEHLIGCGFRNFAYCGIEGLPWSAMRGALFVQHLAAAGFVTHVYTAPPSLPANDWHAERRFLAEWLKGLPKPLGVMACNDDRGEQVIEACKTAGLQVPDQVAIIGADNDDLVCDLCDPPLSSVAIQFERAGYAAAELLAQLMRRRKAPDRKIVVRASHVVTRRSTDIVAVDDPQLAAALRYIRENARRVVTVPEVARNAGLSRRVLEKRFRRLLRRSALSEIRRARVAELARRLIETNEPISRIALDLGFGGAEHVARYFRREVGVTPRAFRREFGPR